MVMPARVADAQGRDVLCGEGAAGMQQVGVAPKQIQSAVFGSKSLVRAFHPGMKNTATRRQRLPSEPLRSKHGIQHWSL